MSSARCTIDRVGRDQLIEVLVDWRDSQISMNQLLARLNDLEADLKTRTKEPVDQSLVDVLDHWLGTIDFEFDGVSQNALQDSYYSSAGVIKHDRNTWNQLERERLLLTSNASLVTRIKAKSLVFNLLAAILLGVYVWVVFRLGWMGGAVILLSYPLACLAWPLLAWRSGGGALFCNVKPDPFVSTRQILEVRRRLPDFRKKRYNPANTSKHKRGWIQRFAHWVGWLVSIEMGIALFGLFSPLILLRDVFKIGSSRDLNLEWLEG